MNQKCDLCQNAGGERVWSDTRCRVVLVADDAFPGYCRVIWNDHVAEFSSLSRAERTHVMDVVCGVECALRKIQRPDKINLASLGNLVPHLHWHVIPRWRDDSHFPQPIWAAPARVAATTARGADAATLGPAIAAFLDDFMATKAGS